MRLSRGKGTVLVAAAVAVLGIGLAFVGWKVEWARPGTDATPLPPASSADPLSQQALNALGPVTVPPGRSLPPSHPTAASPAESGEGPDGGAGTPTGAQDRGGGGNPILPLVATDRLVIPSLGVDAPLAAEAIDDQQLVIPGDVHTVGWWSGGGALSGGKGTLLLAGHVNYVGQGAGALSHLADVGLGSPVLTTGPDGAVQAWRISSVVAVPKEDLPQDIFDASGPRRLVVVTCGGQLLPTGHYVDNVIATALPVSYSGTELTST